MPPLSAPRAAASRLATAEATAIAGVLSLLPRLWVAIAWAREPVWDGHYYDFGARRIAHGLGYSADRATDAGLVWQPWCHYPVGYSGFLGAVYAVFGDGPSVAPVANAVVGAALVCLVHRLALRLTTPVRAIVAAALVALSPALVAYTPLLMTEPLAAAGLVAAPLAYLSMRARHRTGAAVAAGVILGLVRPQSAICAPAMAFLAWSDADAASLRERLRRSGTLATIATIACIAVVAPWTIRNCRVMDGCAVVSTNGGWNLAIGASPRATGRFEALHASDGCREVTGQVQQDRCWQTQGLAWIRARPGRWLALVPKKLGYTFDHQSFAVGYLGEADPTAWPEERRATLRALLTVTGRALLALAAFAMVGIPRRPLRPRAALPRVAAGLVLGALACGAAFGETFGAWPLAVAIPALALARRHVGPELGEEAAGLHAYLAFVVGSTCVVHAVFFGEDRYQMVVVPTLAMLAALSLSRAGPAKPDEAVARDV